MKNHFRKAVAILCLLTAGIAASAQQRISGTVVDSEGLPVIGASVLVQGTTNGTVTDVDGKYTLSVPANVTLEASCIGYTTKTAAVSAGSSTYDFILEEDPLFLEDVVVIGYQTVKRRDLTGSVSSVGSETIGKVPVTSAAAAISGRLAGVQVTTTDGSPDAEILIRVRGGGSVTGDNSPLYIIDGFPASNMNDVAPTDIASIDVLKDASATAIYGSQGANGVIIITTKSAKGGRTMVSYNGYVMGKRLARRKEVLDNYEFALANYELAAFDGDSGIKSFQSAYGAFEDLYLYNSVPGTDWQDDMFGNNVLSHSHNVSIQGGTDKTKYSMSVTYQKDGGLMVNNDFSRLTGNFKLSHEISDKLHFDFQTRISDAVTNGSGTAGGTYKIRSSQAVTTRPVKGLSEFTVIDPSTLSDDEYDEWVRSNMTLAEQSAAYWKRKLQKSFQFTGGLTWDVVKGLKLRAEGGYTWGFNENQQWWSETTSNASYEGGLPLADWTKSNAGKIREAVTATYDVDFGKNHHLTAMIGQEINSNRGNQNYMKGTKFSVDLSAEDVFANFALSDGDHTITSKVDAAENLASFFGRLNYDLLDRYLFTVTFRADGSSKFAPGKQWGYFPAGAFAWRVSSEPWMSATKRWLSDLKLRASYGTVGNNRIANTLYMLTYSTATAKAYGVGDVPNVYYSGNTLLPNPDLTWETTITRNVGLDFDMFRGRLTGTVEAYHNSAKDLLIERAIVAPGYKTTMENTAETSNMGVEASINAYIVEKKDFSLSFNFNIGYNKSNVEALANGLNEMYFSSGWASTDNKNVNDFLVRVGMPVGQMVGWEVDMNDPYYTTSDFSGYANGKYTLKDGVATTGLLGGKAGIRPGTIKLVDKNHDGVVDTGDLTVIGCAQPKITGGFGLNMAWKGFDFSALFNYVWGNQVFNADKIASAQQYRVSYPNLLNIMNRSNRYTYIDGNGELVTDLNALAAMNEGANKKAMWTPWSFGNANIVPTSWAVEDGSFLRLQNVTLGYTIPERITERFACSQFRVYCTLNNVFVLTNYSGYDPEVSSSIRGSAASGLTPGVDYSCYPKSFGLTLGANITFAGRTSQSASAGSADRMSGETALAAQRAAEKALEEMRDLYNKSELENKNLKSQLDDARAEAAKAVREKDEAVRKALENSKKSEVDEALTQMISFVIGSWDLEPLQAEKIGEIAKALKNNKDAKVVISGHVDTGTGSNERNGLIARKRAEVVAGLLKEAGIDAGRISVVSDASEYDSSAPAEANRVAVCLMK